MFLYFDKRGQLKEIINDEMIKQGNYGINKIYVYIEEFTPRSINANYLLPDGTTLEYPDYTERVQMQIPFNPKRDLIYFKYYTNYYFNVIDLENNVDEVSPLDQAGTVWCSLEAIGQDFSIKQLGDFTFNVETTHGLTNEVATQEYLSLSNYQYFKSLMNGLGTQIANINLKLDEYGYIELTAETSSGEFTEEQLLEAEKEQCVINWNGTYYYKTNETEESYWFTKINDEYISNIILDKSTGEFHTSGIHLQRYLTESSVTNGTLTKMLGFDSDGNLKDALIQNDTDDLPLISIGTITNKSIDDICQLVWGNTSDNLSKPRLALRKAYFVYDGGEHPSCLASISLFNYGGTLTYVMMTIELGSYILKCYRNQNESSWNIKRIENPMTTSGDLIVGGSSGTPSRLAKGTAGQVLKVNSGGTSIEWADDSVNDLPLIDLGTIRNHTVAEILNLVWGISSLETNTSKVALRKLIGNYTDYNGNQYFYGENCSITAYKPSTYTYIEIDVDSRSRKLAFTINDNTNSWTTYKFTHNPMTNSEDLIIGSSGGYPTRLAKGNNNELLGVNNSGNLAYTKNLPYITTAPTADNTGGGIIIVVLDSEPATYYDGYYYIITE